MGRILIPGLPEAEPAAEPWPVDEHTIRIDEMFARQLDTEFAGHVRGLLHHPETGIAAQSGEAALSAIAGALPALNDLKERTISQAIGPRQRSILEPLIETRLDWAAGTLGRLAQRATVEVDDQSIADRIAGLNQDAVTSWRDPAYLRKLGRTTVEELRYQGERRGWDPAETDKRVRSGLSDLYAGAVEIAIGQDDLDGASGLYDHARPVIDPERQAAIDRRFVRARETALYRDVDRDMAGIPIEPAGPPGAEVFAERAVELTPEGASDGVRAGIAQVAAFAQHRAERQWQKNQAEAGVAALDWLEKNPDASMLAIPPDIRDWLAPDQWRGSDASIGPGGRAHPTTGSFGGAVHHAVNVVREAMRNGRLSAEAGDRALLNLDNRNVTIVTVGTGSARNGVIELIVGGDRRSTWRHGVPPLACGSARWPD